ncbi:MAG: hypothetical protein ABIP48_33210, partial [Planctomycetota bacterium]
LAELIGPSGKADFASFEAVVQFVFLQFAYWREWRSLQPHFRIALAWAHAYRVYAIMRRVGISEDWIGDTFGNLATEIPPEPLGECGLDQDICHPSNLTYVGACLSGLAYVLRGDAHEILTPSLREQFIDRGFHGELHGLRMPRQKLLRDVTRAQNVVASFFGADREIWLSPVLGEELCKPLGSSFLQEFTEDAVTKMLDEQTAPDDRALAWLRVALVLGDLPPYPTVAEQLQEAAGSTDFGSLARIRVDYGLTSISAASQQAIHMADRGVRHKLRNDLLAIVALAVGKPGGELKSASARSVLGTTFNLARAAPTLRERCEELSGTLRSLAQLWTGFRPFVKGVAERLATDLPIAEAKYFWALSTYCRAV